MRKLITAAAICVGAVGLAGPALANSAAASTVPDQLPTYQYCSTYQGLRACSGYWLVASDGGVFAFGTAVFFGSMGGKPLNRPIVGMAATPTGGGYWLVASDGGVFAFGNAQFYGSLGGQPLVSTAVGIAAASTGGYYVAVADGQVFGYGDASANRPALAPTSTAAPVIGLAAGSPNGMAAVYLATNSGQVDRNGSAVPSQGISSVVGIAAPVATLASTGAGTAYWLASSGGDVYASGLPSYGSRAGQSLNAPVVGIAAAPGGEVF